MIRLIRLVVYFAKSTIEMSIYSVELVVIKVGKRTV